MIDAFSYAPRAFRSEKAASSSRASRGCRKIDHDHVFFLDSGAPIQNLQCRRSGGADMQSLKLGIDGRTLHVIRGELEPDGRQERPLGRQAARTYIVTMLRIYAAWAEGAVEADVEAIKRSMNLTSIRRESPALNNLAVDLPVAEDTDDLGAFASRCPAFQAGANTCFDTGKTAQNWIISYGWGGRIRTR